MTDKPQKITFEDYKQLCEKVCDNYLLTGNNSADETRILDGIWKAVHEYFHDDVLNYDDYAYTSDSGQIFANLLEYVIKRFDNEDPFHVPKTTLFYVNRALAKSA
jgi:hypothetical protein